MPTIRQKKAAKAMVENGGIVSKAMITAGYTKKTAKTPQKLTQSKGWKELMDKYLPDDLLGKKHRELLEVPKKVRTFIKGELETEYEELDSQAVSKGLDMAYKLKGKYAPDKIEHSGALAVAEISKKKYANIIARESASIEKSGATQPD